MQPENTREQQVEHARMVKEGLSQWPEDLGGRYGRLNRNSHAKRHADEILRAIGEFKVRLIKILDGNDAYQRRKESGTKEPVMDRLYQG